MFEKALLWRLSHKTYVDIGAIAETLLFYQNCHFHFDRGSLAALIQALGPSTVTRLLERPGVFASFSQDNFGVITNTIGGLDHHDFSVYRLAAGIGRPNMGHSDEIDQVLRRSVKGDLPRRARRQIVEKLTPFRPVVGDEPAAIILAVREGIMDGEYLSTAARLVVENLVDGFRCPASFYFRVNLAGTTGLLVDTNLDFERANAQYHRVVPKEHSSLTEAYILGHLLDATFDEYLAANYMAELVTAPLYSGLIRLRSDLMLRRRVASEQEIGEFVEFELGSAKAIREAILEGRVTFEQFLNVLDEGERFRSWLAGKTPDVALLKAYYDEVTRESWIDKLPSKSARFVLASGIGIAADLVGGGGVGSLVGLSAGAVDTFLLSCMIDGWRPSHFIQGALKTLVS